MSFIPPLVQRIVSDGSQFITEQGRVMAAMDATAAAAQGVAEREAASARTAASIATIAADRQVLAAETAARAAAVASARTIEAQERAAVATGAAQARTAASAELAAAREIEAAHKAAVAVQIAADKQIVATEAVRIANEKTAAAAEASALKGVGGGGKSAATMGLAGAAVGAGLALAAHEALSEASKYEQATTLLQTAGGELASNMQTVRDGILEVARATGTSTEQLSEGMFLVEKAGYRGADGLNVLKMAAQGARAENVDLATMTDALTSMMMSYHMGADEATSATNQLVAGAGSAKTTMQLYASSLSTVLPVASAAGISFAEVGGAISTLTQHGTSAAESTQELSNTIRGLQAPNNVAVNAMQQLGINVTDLTSNLGKRGLTGTLDIITDAIGQKLGPAGLVVVDSMKKSATATADLQTMIGKMPPALAANAKAFLDGTISQKEFQKSFKDMGAEGSAQGKQFMTLAQQVSGYNDKIKAGGPAAETATAALKAILGGATGMNTALMLVGENMGTFKDRVHEIDEAGKQNGANISTWALTEQELAVQTGKVQESFQTMSIVLGTALAPAAKVVMGVLTGMFTFFAEHKEAAIALGIALGVLTVGLLAAAAAMWVISLTPMALTIGAIVIGVTLLIAVIVLLVANWDQVVAWLTQIWGGFVNWIKEVIDGFVNWWNEIWGGFGNWVKEVWDGFVSWIRELWTGFVGWLMGIVNGMLDWWNGIWTSLSDAVNGAMGFVQDIISGALNFIGGIWEGFWNGPFGRLIENVFKLIVATIEFALAWIGVGIRTSVDFISGVWNTAWSAVSSFFTGIWNGIVGFLTPIVTTVQSTITNALTLINAIWNSIWSSISSFFTGIWNSIVSFVTGAVDQTVSAISGPMNAVSGTVNDVLSNIWNFFVTAWNNVLNTVNTAWDSIVNGVTGGVNNVVNTVSGIGQKILDAIGGFVGQMFSAGQNIIGSLAKGITDGVGAVADAIGNVVNTIAEHMPHSPAKRGALSGRGYTLYAGQKLVDDLALGMENRLDAVNSAASSVALAAAGPYTADSTTRATTTASGTRRGGGGGEGGDVHNHYYITVPKSPATAEDIVREIGYSLG